MSKMLQDSPTSIFNSKLFPGIIGVPRISQWRGFTWWGTGPGDLGDEIFQWGLGEKPQYMGSGRHGPPEAEAKCEINVHFVTFFCRKFSI